MSLGCETFLDCGLEQYTKDQNDKIESKKGKGIGYPVSNYEEYGRPPIEPAIDSDVNNVYNVTKAEWLVDMASGKRAEYWNNITVDCGFSSDDGTASERRERQKDWYRGYLISRLVMTEEDENRINKMNLGDLRKAVRLLEDKER